MKIIKLLHIEDCFDGSLIKDCELTENVSMNFLNFLKNEGVLNYYANFAKPFYTFELKGILTIKGILNSNILRIRLYDKYKLKFFEILLIKYNQSKRKE